MTTNPMVQKEQGIIRSPLRPHDAVRGCTFGAEASQVAEAAGQSADGKVP